MAKSDSKSLILKTLNDCLKNDEEQGIIRVLQGKRPQGNLASFFMEAARLIVILKGRGTFRTVEGGDETTFDVAAGQLLFLSEGTWINPVPKTSYSSLGILLGDKSTRITIHSRKVVKRHRQQVLSRYLAQWQTHETLGSRGKHLLALLRDPPSHRLGSISDTLTAKMLYADLINLIESASESSNHPHTILWQSVCDYLSEHWSDPDLSRESVAHFFNRHPNYFSRFFHTHAKQNFRSYVNEMRLQRSLILLKDLRYNVTDVSTLCGFTDLQYFIRCFRERFGLTPGQYRKRKEF